MIFKGISLHSLLAGRQKTGIVMVTYGACDMHLKTVNKALAQAGIAAELVRGEGYFYFVGPDMDLTREAGVYGVYRLNDFPLSLWIQEARHRCQAHD